MLLQKYAILLIFTMGRKKKVIGALPAVVVCSYILIVVRHRIHIQPHRHQFVIHVPCTEVAVPCFLVAFLAGERGTHKSAALPGV